MANGLIFKQNKFLSSIVVFLFFLNGCAGKRPTASENNERLMPPYEEQSIETKDDLVLSEKEQALTLYFPPGFVRSFASVGLLKYLVKEKIPIKRIVVAEFGAIPAVLFAQNKSTNEMEWSLTKLKDEKIFSKSFHLKNLFSKNKKSYSELTQYFNSFFDSKTVENLKIEVHILYFDSVGGELKLLSTGNLTEAVLSSISDKIAFIHPKHHQSITRVNPMPISFIKEKFPESIICTENYLLNVKTDLIEDEMGYYKDIEKNENNIISELALADIVITPDLSDIGFLDFSKKNKAIFLGEQAARASIGKIKSGLMMEKSE